MRASSSRRDMKIRDDRGDLGDLESLLDPVEKEQLHIKITAEA